jgi:uncharacterized cofD-like protein
MKLTSLYLPSINNRFFRSCRFWRRSVKHLVTIGGGSGQFSLLSGLRDLPDTRITAVVAMTDSGGSTGRLRDELGALPPGDVLKCLLALSPHREIARQILLKRFSRVERLRGHNAGNMLLTMLSWYSGSFAEGVSALAEILEARGEILPVTTDNATLVAELTDGSRIFGEGAIDVPRGTQREKIRDVFLVPRNSGTVKVHPPVLDAVQRADAVIIGPGDLFTSILPNLIVPGVGAALRSTAARLVYVVNIMTKFGETHQFRARDFVIKLEAVIGRPIDLVVCNRKAPGREVLARYQGQQADWVRLENEDGWWDSRRPATADLIDTAGGVARHDPAKLAKLISDRVLTGRRDRKED